MHTVTTRRCLITIMVVALLTAAAITAINRYGKYSRVFGPAGTIQSRIFVKKRVDVPREAYRIWKAAGYRGRAIVFVSDRWESFDPDELIPAQMFRAYPLQLYNTARLFEDDFLNDATFLYVASLNGIVRKIVAIVPESEVGRMREAARKVKNSRVSDKGVYITRLGFPRWFTTAARFDGAAEPVLLYVGASYFRTAEPDELYHRLAASGLRTDCVILCNETGNASVTPLEIARLSRFAQLMGVPSSHPDSAGKSTSPLSMQRRTLPAS